MSPTSIDSTERRVLLIGSRFAADSMEAHVIDALKTLGCVTAYASTGPYAESLGSLGNAVLHKITHAVLREPERLTENSLLKRAQTFEPALILILQGNHLSPKTVARLRNAVKCPIVCWCQDHIATLGRQYMLGAGYDAVFVKDRYMQELFSATVSGTPFHYLPEACNPRIHRPLPLTPEDRTRYGCELMIFGTLYYYRQAILSQLNGFDLKRWGNAPEWFVNRLQASRAGPEIFLDDKVRAVRSARIALNPLHYAEIDALNCRAFELAGCGAFQLVTHKPVLTEHFNVGVELDSFRSVDELIEKIRHYLQHPERAAEMAMRAQLRAHGEHTYELRLREIFSKVLNVPVAVEHGGAKAPVAMQAAFA